MTYNSKETSISDGSPFFLYEFNTYRGVYRYCNLSWPIEALGETWEPIYIKHGEIKQSPQMSKNNLKVSVPHDINMAVLFKGWTPDQVVTLTLRRGHIGETEFLVFWIGRVSSHEFPGNTLELTCDSLFTSLRQSGAGNRFQKTCRHSLYGRGCNLDKADFSHVHEVDLSLSSSLNIRIISAPVVESGYWDRGMVEFSDGSSRMILSGSGSNITISRSSHYWDKAVSEPGYGNRYGMDYGGTVVTLHPGCDKTISTCKDKFDNLKNQGGFKWIPSKNPMGGSSIV